MFTFKACRWKEEDLAKRLCQLLYGSDDVWKDDMRWQIGRSNDFWLHPLGNERYRFNSRYGTNERMNALAVVMEWLLHVEIIPDP
jgi:hypothetical protein